MNSKKIIALLVFTSIFSIILFIVFLILWLKEKKKSLLEYGESSKIIKTKPFELDGENILVCFSSDYSLRVPRSFIFEFMLEPYSEGAIVSSRIGNKGWSLEINNRRKLVFYSDSEKVESREMEILNRKHIYKIIYEYPRIRLKRDEIEVANGELRIESGIGPLFLGMTLSYQNNKITCQPTSILLGKLYNAYFLVNQTVLGIFNFEYGRKIYMDSLNRKFIQREADDFIFDVEKNI